MLRAGQRTATDKKKPTLSHVFAPSAPRSVVVTIRSSAVIAATRGKSAVDYRRLVFKLDENRRRANRMTPCLRITSTASTG